VVLKRIRRIRRSLSTVVMNLSLKSYLLSLNLSPRKSAVIIVMLVVAMITDAITDVLLPILKWDTITTNIIRYLTPKLPSLVVFPKIMEL
jgi:hypothetical protein